MAGPVPELDLGLELDLETDLLDELFDPIEPFDHELDSESVVELFQFQLYQLVEVKIDVNVYALCGWHFKHVYDL